jgi:hypothetical protein
MTGMYRWVAMADKRGKSRQSAFKEIAIVTL